MERSTGRGDIEGRARGRLQSKAAEGRRLGAGVIGFPDVGLSRRLMEAAGFDRSADGETKVS